MNRTIEKLIERYEAPGDFTHPAVEDIILKEAERELGISLPSEYLAFLREYGHGGIGGVEVIGLSKNGEAQFVHETVKYRKYGLPDEYIVIENCDEWLYCLSCISGNVAVWSHGNVTPAFDTFDAYLLDRFNDAAENIV